MSDNPYDQFADNATRLPGIVVESDEVREKFDVEAKALDAAFMPQKLRSVGEYVRNELGDNAFRTQDPQSMLYGVSVAEAIEIHGNRQPGTMESLNMGAVQRGVAQGVRMLGESTSLAARESFTPEIERDLTLPFARQGQRIRDQDRERTEAMKTAIQDRVASFGDTMSSFGLDMEQSAPMRSIEGVSDIKTFKDFRTFMAEGALEAIGSSVPFFVGGAVAGVPGAVLTGWGMGRGEMIMQLDNERYRLLGLAHQAERSGMQKAARNFRAAADKFKPENNLNTINGAGLAIGALDSIVPGRFFTSLPGGNELKKNLGLAMARRIAAHAAQGAIAEGATEMMQEAIAVTQIARIHGAASAMQYVAALQAQTEQLLTAGLMGAAGGTAFGTASGAREAIGMRSQTDPALMDQAKRNPYEITQEEEAAPATPAEAPAPPKTADDVDVAIKELEAAETAAAARVAELEAAEASPVEAVAEAAPEAIDAAPAVALEDVAPALETAQPESLMDRLAEVTDTPIDQLTVEEAREIAETATAEAGQATQAAASVSAELEQARAEVAKLREQREALSSGIQVVRTRSADLENYIAGDGIVTPAKVAESLNVTPDQATALLDDAAARNKLKKTPRGSYLRNVTQPNETVRGTEARTAIADLAREMAPMLPPGTKVKSFAELADIPQFRNAMIDKDGKVVTRKSGGLVDAFQADDAIYIATYAVRPGGRISHEALHALVNAGVVSDQELTLLAERARKTKVFTPAMEAQYRAEYADRYDAAGLDAAIREEAAAHLIEARVNGQSFGRNVNGIIDRILEFFERIGNALRSKGFQSTEDVVRSFLTGEMAERVHPAELIGPVSRYPSEDQARVMMALRDQDTGRSMRRTYDLTTAGHVSKYEFDRFDWNKIGGGEGGQWFGYGHYFASSDRTLDAYESAFTTNRVSIGEASVSSDEIVRRRTGVSDSVSFNVERTNTDLGVYTARSSAIKDAIQNDEVLAKEFEASQLYQTYDKTDLEAYLFEFVHHIPRGRGWRKAVDRHAKLMADSDPSPGVAEMTEFAKSVLDRWVENGTIKVEEQKPVRYRVSLDMDPDRTVYLDKNLTEQPPFVREALTRFIGERAVTGQSVLQWLMGIKPKDAPDGYGLIRDAINRQENRRLSEQLAAAGVHGYKFLNGKTRGKPAEADPDAYNYVVFDDDRIQITHKDGTPVEAERKAPVQAGLAGAGDGKHPFMRGDVMYAIADQDTGRSMRRDLDTLGYYSAALEAARSWPQAKGTAEQALMWLKKSGAKDAEIEMGGLKSFLDGKASVTRDELVAHLEANRVALNEVEYGGKAVEEKRINDEAFRLMEEGNATAGRSGGWMDDPIISARIAELQNELDEVALRPETKFSGYSLDPSNPTYRETVLHLPAKTKPTKDGSSLYANMRQRRDEGQFISGHFPEPNITGHMMTSMVKVRADEVVPMTTMRRFDVQGLLLKMKPEEAIAEGLVTPDEVKAVRKQTSDVFLIDQIQSDWGQRLREDGGARDEAKIAELRDRLIEAKDQFEDIYNNEVLPFFQRIGMEPPEFSNHTVSRLRDITRGVNFRNVLSGNDPTNIPELKSLPHERLEEIVDHAKSLEAKALDATRPIELVGAELKTHEAATPGNPLVNTTDQWVNTTLRRAITQAVEADADYIAIPSGDTVLIYNPGDTDGMRGFYDGIVPKNLRNLLKKLDKATPNAERVGQLETPTAGMKGNGFTVFPLTDAAKAKARAEGQPMFAFAGERAQTADLDALSRAKEMMEQGRTRDDIWKDTGWFQGVDGKWRWEIDDSQARIDEDLTYGDATIGETLSRMRRVLGDARTVEILNHPELSDAYPWIDAVKVREMASLTSAGVYSRPNDQVAIRGSLAPDESLSIMLHELQHAIQYREGFAEGGSPRRFSPEEIAAERQRIMANEPAATGWTSVGTAAGDMTDLSVGGILYRRLAGEVEARAVQARMNMTPEERRNTPPWQSYDVPEDQQIVRSADAVMYALSQDMEPVTPGLDMSREARMERARQMGFDTSRVLYHGTWREFSAFDGGSLAWFSDQQTIAADYGRNQIAAYVRAPRILVHDVAAKPNFDWRPIVSQAKRDGYDAVRLDNKPDRGSDAPQTQFVIFDPTNIRSVNAAFDPAHADSPNLMYAFAPSEPAEPREPQTSAAKSLQSIISDLARDIGLTIRQGLSQTDVGRAARRAGLGAVYNPLTGIIRTDSMANLRSITGAVATALRHRFADVMRPAINDNLDELTLPVPREMTVPEFAPDGASGIALSEAMRARIAKAVKLLVSASLNNERGQMVDARKAQAQADVELKAIRRRLGDAMTAAVIRDVLDGFRSISPDGALDLLIIADTDAFTSRAQIAARLEGMGLAQSARDHILGGKAIEDMRSRARQVALEGIRPGPLRDALAKWKGSQQTSGDLVTMLRDAGLSARRDLLGDGSAQAMQSTVQYVRQLAIDADLSIIDTPILPSLFDDASYLPSDADIDARIDERFSDGDLIETADETPTEEERNTGFDAWLSAYITNPDAAFNMAPAMYDQFEAILDARDPILLAKLISTQEAIAARDLVEPGWRYRAQVKPSLKKIWWDDMKRDAQVYGIRGAMAIRASDLYWRTMDSGHGIFLASYEMLRGIERQTGTRMDLPQHLDPYVLARMAPHSRAHASRDIERGIRNRATRNHEGPGLIDALVTAIGPERARARDQSEDSNYRQFSAYLVAKYAAEEWARFRDGTKERPPLAPVMGGEPNAEIAGLKAEIARIEAQHPNFIEAADQISDYQLNLLKLQRDAGLITPEVYDTLSEDRDYVPFFRVFDEAENVSGGTIGQGPGGVLKRKRGSDRDVIDPIASIAQKTFETRALIAGNDVKKAMIGLAERAGPNGGIIAERISATQLKRIGVDLDAVMSNAAREADIDTNDRQLMTELMHTLLGNNPEASAFISQTINPGNKPIQFFWEDGELQAMMLGDGENGHRLAQMMTDSLNTFGKESFDFLTRIAMVPAQAIRAGVVTHPEFALANIFRDGLMAFIYDRRATPFVTQIKGLIDVIGNADYVQDYYAEAGMLGGEATDAFNKFMSDRNTQALVERGYRFKLFASWDEFREGLAEGARSGLSGVGVVTGALTGGAMGTVAGPAGAIAGFAGGAMASSYAMNRIGLSRVGAGNNAVGVTVGAIGGAAVGGLPGAMVGGAIGGMIGGQTLVKFGEITETATRTRLFKHAYDRATANGLDRMAALQEAAMWSHDYTDYSRHGSKMTSLNAVIPFLNANLQGNDIYIRRLLGKGQQGYNSGLLYPLYRAGLLDDSKMTDRQRQEMADSAYTWAMTVFGLGGISAAWALLYGDDERLKDFDSYMRASNWLIPVGDEIYRLPKPFQTVWFSQLIERAMSEAHLENSTWKAAYLEDMWNTWSPPMLPAALNVGGVFIGLDLDRGREITPYYMKMQGLRAQDQYAPFTSDFSRWAGAELKVSPLYVEQAIHEFGASWGRTFTSLNVPGLPWYNPDRPAQGPEEQFILRRFMWKAGKSSESGQAFREIMGAEEPFRLIGGRMAQGQAKLGVAAKTYRDFVEGGQEAAALDFLSERSPRERGYAILEANYRGRGELELRRLHPMNRANEIAAVSRKIGREVVDKGLMTGRKGTSSYKEITLSPREKRIVLDVLSEYAAAEQHNALVMVDERGWQGRAKIETADMLRELKVAVPAAYKELMARFDKSHIVPLSALEPQWPAVKAALESPDTLEAIRKGRSLSQANVALRLARARAYAARRSDGYFEPVRSTLEPAN